MKLSVFRRTAVVTVSLALAAASAARAIDLSKANPVKWFKNEEKSAPDTVQKQNQEAAAASMMSDARLAVSTGNNSRAQDIYKSVVRQYPFTDAAGDAQFEYAHLLHLGGKFEDSAEAFQKFITD